MAPKWPAFIPAWTCVDGSSGCVSVRLSPWQSAGLRWAAHAACALPLALLAWSVFRGTIGPDPIAQLTHATGEWALRFLLLCLAMTPLRRLTNATWPLQFRRMLGLWAFAYASTHLAVYVVLDLGAYWAQVFDDIAKRPFITVGFAAWLLLIPLAITSTKGWMKRMGRRWGQLHRLIYAVAILAVLHWLWLVKVVGTEPLVYVGIVAVLLGVRVWWARSKLLRQPRGA